MPEPVYKIAVALLLCSVGLASAGELRLDNGAVLPGELVSIGPKNLVWKADKIGDITVAKSDVLDLRTSHRASVRVALHQPPQADCLVEVNNSKWSMDCGAESTQPVAFAQLRSLPPKTGSTGKLAIALDIDRGANPSEELTADLNARWLRPGYRHNVDISTDYEQTNGTTTDDNADANYQYDLLRDNGWYWFGRTRYYRDEFEALEQVYAGMGGLGRELTPSDDLTLSIQSGPALMYFYYQNKGWQTEPGGNVRWTAVWHTPWRGIDLSHSGDFGWVFSISDGYLFQSKSGITVPLYKGLIAEMRLDYDRSGVQVGDNGDYDLSWVLALGYKW
ncbi:MAG: DUF481 domain-containing protein [Halioglobus sp.]|nr:DUF481 domain-containing protein [Halioglobus sp.]